MEVLINGDVVIFTDGDFGSVATFFVGQDPHSATEWVEVGSCSGLDSNRLLSNASHMSEINARDDYYRRKLLNESAAADNAKTRTTASSVAFLSDVSVFVSVCSVLFAFYGGVEISV